MLTNKASKKVNKLLKELADVLSEEGCFIQSSDIKYNESFEGQNPAYFDLNLEISGFIDIQ